MDPKQPPEQPPTPPPSHPPSHPKFGSRLAMRLLTGTEPVQVTVTLREAKPLPELLAMGLRGGADSNIATGVVERDRLLDLARRDDVVRIDAMPELYPSGGR